MADDSRNRAELVLLVEGHTDRKFFETMLEGLDGMPDMAIPWPKAAVDADTRPHEDFHGCDSFHLMLTALKQRIRLGIAAPKGVLIVADAQDNRRKTFQNVRAQIRKANAASGAEAFPLPAAPLELARGAGRMPSVEVMLIPLSGPGGLETMFVEYLRRQRRGVHKAAHAYLTTAPVDISKWNAEKRSKAHLQCIIAGTHKRNPALPAHRFFSGRHRIIDPGAPLFRPIRERLAAFGRQAGQI